MNLTNNLQTWNELLDVSPVGSVLMGGAIRDWVCNVEAKDYDIFCTQTPDFFDAPGWVKIPKDFNKIDHAENYHNLDIESVHDYDVTTAAGHVVRVQMIGVNHDDPREFFKSFDHTLTLGRYGGKGLLVDKRMTDSLINHEVTCLNSANKKKSLERAIRAVLRIDPEGVDGWKFLGF